MALPYPTLFTLNSCTASCMIYSHLVDAIQGHTDISYLNQAQMQKDVQVDIRRHNSTNAMRVLTNITGHLPPPQALQLQGGSKTGTWLYV